MNMGFLGFGMDISKKGNLLSVGGNSYNLNLILRNEK